MQCPQPTPQLLKAFDIAKDQAAQLITITGVVLAVTLTFTKDIVSRVTNRQRRLLRLSWMLYLVSIITGIQVLGALSEHLNRQKSVCRLPASAWNWALVQETAFGIGLILTAIVFASAQLRTAGPGLTTDSAPPPDSSSVDTDHNQGAQP